MIGSRISGKGGITVHNGGRKRNGKAAVGSRRFLLRSIAVEIRRKRVEETTANFSCRNSMFVPYSFYRFFNGRPFHAVIIHRLAVAVPIHSRDERTMVDAVCLLLSRARRVTSHDHVVDPVGG